MNPNAKEKIIAALKKGLHTRKQLREITRLSEDTVSKQLKLLRADGHIKETRCVCPSCGAQKEYMVELLLVPAKAKHEPKLGKPRKVPAPAPPLRTEVTLPKHDGSVFGLMTAQLGA